MKPWIKDRTWFSDYASGTLTHKHWTASDPPIKNSDISKALTSVFMKVYRAVAFDIDGTLTKKDEAAIDPDMARLIGQLLQRSVPVILITGRGRGSTRKAAIEIREYAGLSDWYTRRLHCITHNGVYLLQTPTLDPSQFLVQEHLIGARIHDLPLLVKQIKSIFDNECKIPSSRVEITQEPNSIRIAFESADDRGQAENALKKLVLTTSRKGIKLYLSHGSYAMKSCLDIAATNKKLALEYIAAIIGVPADRILRVGDQGQRGGNDFDLLNTPSGFSVDRISEHPVRCFPVLDTDMTGALKGVEATERLLQLVLLFPPLSIAPEKIDKHLKALRNFEKLALVRSRAETETVTQRFRVRLRYLLPDNKDFANSHTLMISDIYDQYSGAITFRDWEFDSIPEAHKVYDVFDIHLLKPKQSKKKDPKAKWCMYSDTAILLRGPYYYFGMTQEEDSRTLRAYIPIVSEFIDRALQAIDQFSIESVDLTRFKLILAIFDNIRNIILRFLHASFIIEKASKEKDYSRTKRLFNDIVLPHTKYYYNFLLNADLDWTHSLKVYRGFLNEMSSQIRASIQPLTDQLDDLEDARKLFKWRECDHFLQNVTAVQLGLHELRQRQEILNLKRIVAVGLAHGGLELPAIALAVAEARGYDLEAALLKVSIYGSKSIGRKIREGKHDYVANWLCETEPVCMLSDSGDIADRAFILMDDNCTTCVTLQLSRDILVMQGADVVGAIVIRFPGINREVQMAIPGHGFPDPDVLFSFIRGLVAPSPYARLIFPSKGQNPYLDQTKIFDKAEERIIRYLRKNGTPAVKKS